MAIEFELPNAHASTELIGVRVHADIGPADEPNTRGAILYNLASKPASTTASRSRHVRETARSCID